MFLYTGIFREARFISPLIHFLSSHTARDTQTILESRLRVENGFLPRLLAVTVALLAISSV